MSTRYEDTSLNGEAILGGSGEADELVAKVYIDAVVELISHMRSKFHDTKSAREYKIRVPDVHITALIDRQVQKIKFDVDPLPISYLVKKSITGYAISVANGVLVLEISHPDVYRIVVAKLSGQRMREVAGSAGLSTISVLHGEDSTEIVLPEMSKEEVQLRDAGEGEFTALLRGIIQKEEQTSVVSVDASMVTDRVRQIFRTGGYNRVGTRREGAGDPSASAPTLEVFVDENKLPSKLLVKLRSMQGTSKDKPTK